MRKRTGLYDDESGDELNDDVQVIRKKTYRGAGFPTTQPRRWWEASDFSISDMAGL